MSNVCKLSVRIAAFCVLSALAHAEVLGPVYPILEPSILQEIKESLQEKERNGELARLQQEGVIRAETSAHHPAPVTGLTRTSIARSFYWDPTVIANKTITGPDGHILVEAGQRFNPLDQVSMTSWLIFFDATDPEQVQIAKHWVDESQGHIKAILTAGDYADLEQKWGLPVYFDQGGVLVNKFGIHQVPARVVQELKRLRIDEVSP